MKLYKIGFIGIGSIGKRHLQNTVSILQKRNISYNIDVFRSGMGKALESELLEVIDNVFYSFEDGGSNYDIVFITNPTNLHFETIRRFAKRTKNMFIEKPIFDDVNKSPDSLELNKSGIYYVACPLRYSDVIQYIKNKIKLEEIYSCRVICSSYLPDWRPTIDYRDTYSAHVEQGGGVSIDLIHEWDYLYYLLGLPKRVFNIRGRFSDLEISSDDLSVYIAEYDKMVVEIHLDYFGRYPIRELQFFTKEEVIVGDLLKSEVRYLKSGEKVSFRESRNDFQVKELENFFDAIEGKVGNKNDIQSALKVLKIAQEGKV